MLVKSYGTQIRDCQSCTNVSCDPHSQPCIGCNPGGIGTKYRVRDGALKTGKTSGEILFATAVSFMSISVIALSALFDVRLAVIMLSMYVFAIERKLL